MRARGFALTITLWILVLLSVVAMHFSFSTRLGSASTRNFKEDTQAYYVAVSAYEDALAYILSDMDLDVDYVDENGVFRIDSETDPVSGKKEMDGAWVEINVSDEESRLNINRIKRSIFVRLLEFMEVPNDSVQVIADSVLDWKDADDLHHLLGAEDAYYLGFGYKCKDSPLDVPEELLLIRGFEPEFLWGDDDTAPLHQFITTWGNGVNINTAPEEVLEVLGFTRLDIDAIMRHRSNRGPYTTLLPGLSETVTMASSNFRIEVLAGLQEKPQAVRITSVVKRSVGTEGPELKTLYWKEEVESSGS
jgi:general secretion pathway protein K